MHAVVPRFAVNISQVVGVDIERLERLPQALGTRSEKLIEQPLPSGGMDAGGIRDHTVHIENKRVKGS